MFDSVLLYFGFAIVLVGALSILWPLRFLRIRTRTGGTIVALCAVLVVVVVCALPVGTKRVSTPTMKLDEWMPIWQFDEQHVIHVDASPKKVFEAIHAVRADEIFLFRTLIAIRRCGRPGPESIVNAPENKPLLDVATQTTFIYLADEAPREIVVGTVISAPRGLHAPAKLTPASAGSGAGDDELLRHARCWRRIDSIHRDARLRKQRCGGAPVRHLLAHHSSRQRHHPPDVVARDQAPR